MAENFKSSGPIFDELAEFFTGDEWSPEQIEDQPVLRMNFEGEHGHWTCLAFAYDDHERVVFNSLLPVVSYRSRDEAIRFIRSRPRPLALYVFAKSPSAVETAA